MDATGEEYGFPANSPYSDALDVLLNSNEYWHNVNVNKLNDTSRIIAGDTAGTLVGGVGGGLFGFIFGGAIPAIIGGGIEAAILGGSISIAMSEYLG